MVAITKAQLEQASVDADLLDTFVHGTSDETIPTEEGPKPTIAGIAKQALLGASIDTLIGYTFTTGATLNYNNQALLDTASNMYYRWSGTITGSGLVVPANSSPSVLGIGPGKWLAIGDATSVEKLNEFIDDLAQPGADTGDTNVGVKLDFANTIGTTQKEYNARMVSITDWVVGDGTTIDAAALQKASDDLSSNALTQGSTIIIPAFCRVLIDANVTLSYGISLKFLGNGSPVTNQGRMSDIYKASCKLVVDSAATITLKGGNTISGIFAHRRGMTTAESNAANFAGTLFTITGDDVTISDCFVVGFNYFVKSTNVGRQNIYNNKIDCINGISISESHDVLRIANNHAWPFATITATSPDVTYTTTNYKFRNGTFIALVNCDYPKLTDNFNYGHLNGLTLDGCSNPHIIGNSFEGLTLIDGSSVSYYLSSTGMLFTGNTYNVTAMGNNVTHYNNGPYVNASDIANRFVFQGNNILDCKANGIAFVVGCGIVNGNNFTGPGLTAGSGLRILATSGKVDINDNVFHAWQYAIQANGTTHRIGENNLYLTNSRNVYESSPRVIIASAARLPVDESTNIYYVSGSTTMTSMTPTYHGHEITLVFAAALTMTGGGTGDGALRVAGGSLAVPAGGIVKFVYDSEGLASASARGLWRQITSPIAGS
ncbi:tailspike protein [Erwinia phage AH03]|uniref:Tailspike protein n=1 Tax=Erwinia phage AH03 TaxID=2869568 RepID=A0AAE7X0K6_9CAUD|nr:tailspike protein [Erwinia phage AH03]